MFITINEEFNSTKLYDYLWYKDKQNRSWYYFITAHELVTEKNTRLYLELDVFTSYMFSYEFMPTFIDRMHVPRWNGDIPTYNMENEDIEIGEYIQIEDPISYMFSYEFMPTFIDRMHVPRWNGDIPTYNMENEDIEIGEYIQIEDPIDLYTMQDSVIVASSVPIGYVQKPNGTGGSSGGSSGSSWQNGKLSSQGFRFIKGFEGFAPSKYQDSGGYWTIAYGVTAHGEPSIYNELVSESPITEERAAKVSYDLKNSNYGSKILNAVKNLGCTTQYQFDALCSLAYNCGTGVITKSNSLTNAIAKDPTDEETIRPIWEKFYITSNGVQLPGLVARRKQECNMFFNKEFEKRSIGLINSSGVVSGTVTENNGDGWLPDDTNIGEIDGYKLFDNEFGVYMCPVKGGTVTSKYGWRIHPITGVKKFHHGTDIGLPLGTPTVASTNGTISETGYHSAMGNYIYLDDDKGYRTKYMHLSKISVSKGDTVKRGQKVGEIGSTGSSTGSHCHWEIRRISDNESTDPAPILNKGDTV